MDRRGGIRRREWDTFAWFVRSTIMYGLLLCGSYREGGECAKNSVPMLLAEVVSNVVHEPSGCRAPGIAIEPFTGVDEIASNVHLVRTFNLVHRNSWISVVVLGKHNVTYCGSHKGENTQWSVFDPWVFVRDGFHDP